MEDTVTIAIVIAVLSPFLAPLFILAGLLMLLIVFSLFRSVTDTLERGKRAPARLSVREQDGVRLLCIAWDEAGEMPKRWLLGSFALIVAASVLLVYGYITLMAAAFGVAVICGIMQIIVAERHEKAVKSRAAGLRMVWDAPDAAKGQQALPAVLPRHAQSNQPQAGVILHGPSLETRGGSNSGLVRGRRLACRFPGPDKSRVPLRNEQREPGREIRR